VFVSSTLQELAPERAAAYAAIERLRFSPVLFELGARPHPPRALYRAYLEQSHVFVGIYWERYGWVAPGMEISGLEDEYELASTLPKLVYVKRPADEREPGLRDLLERIAADDVSYRRFETPEELAELLADDLALLVSERFARSSGRGRGRTVAIPTPVSSFIGREGEVVAVTELLQSSDVRLVTLMGPGGIGKTRLALEAARRTADEFADGTAFVGLASVTEAEDVAPGIAEALGLARDTDTSPDEKLRSHLEKRELLLVLDNMEHLLQAAPLVRGLLAAAPALTVLVTSRARLDVSGEHCFYVPPMALPAAREKELEALGQSDAVRLFTTRAEAAGWKTSEVDAPIVADIVRRVEGLPLAIELAAAQARLVPAELIHTRLRRRLDLGGGPRDAEERHRTLRSTIAWSYELLDEPARRFFETLSVFVGGFSIDAAAAVVESNEGVEDLLASLVDASLLTTEPAPGSGVRFGMLETIREYASERLGERGGREDAAGRHLAYFVRLADEAYDAPPKKRLVTRLRIDEERQNFRVALEEATRGAPAEAVRLAGALSHLWSFRGLAHQGRDVITRALSAAPDAPAPWRARALLSGAWLAVEQADFEEGDRQAVEALQLFRTLGNTRRLGESLHVLAWSAERRGDTEQAVRYEEECYRVLSTLSDEYLQVDTATSLAGVLALRGDLDEAERLYMRALEYFQLHALDDERAGVLIGLALIDERRGNLASARESFESSVTIARRLENLRFLAWALARLGHVDAGDGRIEDAARSYAEALDLHLDLGDRLGIGYCLERVASVALARNRAEAAAELLGAARTLRAASGAQAPASEQAEVAEIEKDVREQLGEVRFEIAFAEGAALDVAAGASLAVSVLH
jgi:predicted ATPase